MNKREISGIILFTASGLVALASCLFILNQWVLTKPITLFTTPPTLGLILSIVLPILTLIGLVSSIFLITKESAQHKIAPRHHSYTGPTQNAQHNIAPRHRSHTGLTQRAQHQ